MVKHSRWLIQDADQSEQILERMQTHFLPDLICHEQDTLTFYDDFEWRLWRKDFLLASNIRGQIILTEGNDSQTFDNEVSPSFARSFRNQNLSDRLWQVSDIRRLLPMAEVETSVREYALRNFEDEKKVCKLVITRSGYADMWELTSMRGYDKDYREALSCILEAEPENPERHLYRLSLELLDIKPGKYKSKPKTKVPPEMASADACSKMVRKMWKNVRINEDGIIQDLDTEFLHQYRVALRRMRALFAQMKNYIGPEQSLWFKDALGDLARETNRLRDLDVYLEDRDYYFGLVPEKLQPGLEELFQHFTRERNREQKRVAAYLQNTPYLNKVSAIEETLKSCPSEPGEKGHLPIAEVAAQRIRKRYKQIAKDAALIHDQTPDDDVHEIRLDCKKLRYLLEFFGPVLDKERVRPVMQALKKLQDNLGRFNDYSVQRESLEHYLENHKTSEEIQKAVHALSGVLFMKQQKEREQVCGQLEDFLADDVRQLIKQLTQPTSMAQSSKGSPA
ncbi:CHAD domain-containing protein [Oceanospirillum sediminis]|uniref:CHAD domain-containing protein n=1 Tax=Oceanospirillum sediminis TaxID=2760088 RepID=A0A839IQ42_9GAMM|nr:CHAD domain-containing protein [Oceanospirillum sediminis]MBB1486346.1 CHAD domain-containing protein [Oceanospirillum sediminis]